MKNCILLYGNDELPTFKYAGTFRIATELRKNNYEVHCIDVSAFNNDDIDLKLILEKIISKDTLWLGISTSFLTTVFGFPFYKTDNAYKRANPNIASRLLKFTDFIKTLNPDIKLISGGSRLFPLEEYGFIIFKGYVDSEVLEFTNLCAAGQNIDITSITGTEFKDFTQSNIQYEVSDIIKQNDCLPIEVSRGCIFKCKFCAFPMNGKTKGEWIKNEIVLVDEFKRNY